MRWIIQSNLSRERALAELVELLGHHRIPFDLVKVAPFGGGIVPDLEVTGPVVAIGSVSLARHAVRMGWTPGA